MKPETIEALKQSIQIEREIEILQEELQESKNILSVSKEKLLFLTQKSIEQICEEENLNAQVADDMRQYKKDLMFFVASYPSHIAETEQIIRGKQLELSRLERVSDDYEEQNNLEFSQSQLKAPQQQPDKTNTKNRIIHLVWLVVGTLLIIVPFAYMGIENKENQAIAAQAEADFWQDLEQPLPRNGQLLSGKGLEVKLRLK